MIDSNHKLRLSNLIVSPLVTEKSTQASEIGNFFVFKVKPEANKSEIKKAIELMFGVEVISVRVANIKGKTKRFGKNIGKRSDWKKAYVKLPEGQNLDMASA